MRFSREVLNYILQNWKVAVHLIFRTRRFGVNNHWWSHFDSPLGVPVRWVVWDTIRICPIIGNYKLMKFRAIHLGFLHPKEAYLLWPKDYLNRWPREWIEPAFEPFVE